MNKESKEFIVAKNAIIKAGEKIMEVYHRSDFNIEIKDDESPVTDADKASNDAIVSLLQKEFPEYGILSEEIADDKSRLTKEYVWIIDPLDGTKDFVSRNGEFSINLALAKDHEIIMGLIYIPVKKELYYGFKGNGSYSLINDIETRLECSQKRTNLIALASHAHFREEDKKYIQSRSEISMIKQVGSSYKSCLIASGLADIQIKFGEGTKEWDIAPNQIIVEEAGGSLTKPNGEHYTYNREDVYNHDGYFIMNRLNKDFFIKEK